MIYLPLLKLITPKLVAIAAVSAALFAAGWTTNGLRYTAKMDRQRVDALESYAKQRAHYLRQYQTQQDLDEKAAKALSADLQRVRQQHGVLEKELLTAAVVKPDDQICANGGGGNPFGADFARLWNAAATTD